LGSSKLQHRILLGPGQFSGHAVNAPSWRFIEVDELNREKLILASRSPRRAEILQAVAWEFEAITAGIDETLLPAEDAVTYVKRLAVTKAKAVAAKVQRGLVLGADTTVVVEGEILGQPGDAENARRMLSLLSGKWHEVITGVALVRAESKRSIVDHVVTRVRFSEMSDQEIAWYAASGEPFDKAGAYAIQGLASLFVEEVDGEYFNIVGLPIRKVYELTKRI
jgi:septum formation protein